MSYFFFLYQPPLLSRYISFDSISSNVDMVFSINPSANVFVFGDFNVHHRDWLTYSGGTDRPDVIYFFILNDLTQMFNFPTQILTVTLTVFFFWISFCLLMLVFVL